MKATADTVDDLVSAWHDSPTDDGELHEFLGWTWEEYARWVEVCLAPEQEQHERMPRWFGVWFTPHTHGPLVSLGSDEWGRRCLGVRLPRQRALTVAYRWCMCALCRQHCRCGLLWSGWCNGHVMRCQNCGALGPQFPEDYE